MELKAISCVIGAILINLTLGTFYSIGNVFPYIASYMRKRPGNKEDITTEHGTWITAAFLLGQGLFIIVGAFIENRFNSRIACIVGCLIHCASTFMTIWALDNGFAAVVIIYGFGSGLGCGSAYISSIIAAQKWFPQCKGIFTGVIVAGFGLGGLIFTSAQTLYMNPKNKKADEFGYFDQTVYERVPDLFLYMGITFTVAQSIGCILAFPPPQTEHHTVAPASPDPSTTIFNGDLIPNMKSFSSAFNYRVLYVVGFMMMLVAPGVTFVNSLGKRFGQSYIKDDSFLATIVAISAVANATGRFTWGFLIEKFAFSTCFLIKVLLFSTLVILFPFGFILSSRALYTIWMLGLFFGFSGTFVLFPVFIEQIFGSKYHGLIYGILYVCMAFSSILTSALIGSIVAPALESKTNPDNALGIRAALCSVIAALYLISLALYRLLIPVHKFELSIKRRIEEEDRRTKANNQSLFQRRDLYPIQRPNLAEKTADRSNGSLVHKEGSLGSIVRVQQNPDDSGKIKTIYRMF